MSGHHTHRTSITGQNLEGQLPERQNSNLSLVSPTVNVALNVVHRINPKNNKREYLLVEEAKGKKDGGTWYLPAGRVDRGESLQAGGQREAKEEAGVEIKITGVISIDFIASTNRNSKLRFIFLAEAAGNDAPKTTPDHHSNRAAWFTLDEIEKLPLRDDEVIKYISKVDRGDAIPEISMLRELVTF